jgi:hypothetical protein
MMADTVTTRVLFAGTKKYIVHYTNNSDGTGESGVNKLDISELTGPRGAAVSAVRLLSIKGNVSGMVVNILTDHDTDILLWVANASLDYINFEKFGGIKDTGTGGTGDVLFTTVGADAGDSYSLVLEYGLGLS